MKIIRLFFRCLLFFVFGISLCFGSRAEPLRQASFFEFHSASGRVLHTDDFVKSIPYYQAVSLRYARASNGSSWEDFAFNMPFFGFGFYKPYFANNPGFGDPFSIYMFRGSTLRQFTKNLGLVFEMNLGLSVNWKYFDPFDNPYNVSISTPNNVHVGMRLYFEYFLSRHFEFKFGADFNHFSNGASRRPNRGVNVAALSLSLAYNFNPPGKGLLLQDPSLKPPDIPRHIDHTLQFIISNRQTDFDTIGTGLPSRYVDANFSVLGLAYSPMIVTGYRHKWGPSIRLIYDESANARAWREFNTRDEQWYDRVETSKFSDRLSLGLGLTGEITLPVVSFFASIGYSVHNRHHVDKSLFQVLGIKAYLKDNFFGTFGISATQFTVAQFLYWSFGYTISSKPRKKYSL